MLMSKTTIRHQGHHRAGGEAGFSVIELAVVVALVGVLSLTSLIIFGKAKTQYKLSQNAKSLASQIERARSLAIKYNQTLTLGFTSSNKVFGLTCTSCADPKKELPDYSLPSGLTLSAYPTLTIKGNGTISSSNSSVTVTDGQGYQVPISISNSGRTTVGDVTTASSSN